jgi:hypothetical protein
MLRVIERAVGANGLTAIIGRYLQPGQRSLDASFDRIRPKVVGKNVQQMTRLNSAVVRQVLHFERLVDFGECRRIGSGESSAPQVGIAGTTTHQQWPPTIGGFGQNQVASRRQTQEITITEATLAPPTSSHPALDLAPIVSNTASIEVDT